MIGIQRNLKENLFLIKNQQTKCGLRLLHGHKQMYSFLESQYLSAISCHSESQPSLEQMLKKIDLMCFTLFQKQKKKSLIHTFSIFFVYFSHLSMNHIDEVSATNRDNSSSSF